MKIWILVFLPKQVSHQNWEASVVCPKIFWEVARFFEAVCNLRKKWAGNYKSFKIRSSSRTLCILVGADPYRGRAWSGPASGGHVSCTAWGLAYATIGGLCSLWGFVGSLASDGRVRSRLLVPSMSFYSDYIPNFILILSKFYLNFIQILS